MHSLTRRLLMWLVPAVVAPPAALANVGGPVTEKIKPARVILDDLVYFSGGAQKRIILVACEQDAAERIGYGQTADEIVAKYKINPADAASRVAADRRPFEVMEFDGSRDRYGVMSWGEYSVKAFNNESDAVAYVSTLQKAEVAFLRSLRDDS